MADSGLCWEKVAQKVIEEFARRKIAQFNESTFREIVRPLLRKERIPPSGNAIHMPAVRRIVKRLMRKAAKAEATSGKRFAVTPRMKLEALHLAAADHLNDP